MDPQPAHGARLDRLISETYACALGQRPWSGLAAHLARALDSPSAVLRRASARADEGVISSTENFQLDRFEPGEVQHWFGRDLWAERAAGCGLGQIVQTQALIDDATLRRSGFYQDWLRRLHIHHGLGCVFRQQTLGTLVLGVHRAGDAAPFAAADEALLRAWMPHLDLALGSGGQQALYPVASDGAAFLLSADGKLQWANEAAQHWLGRSGPLLVDALGYLRLSPDLAKAAAWMRAHTQALACLPASPPPRALLAHDVDGDPLVFCAAAVNLPGPGPAERPQLLLTVRAPFQRRLDLDVIAGLFKLTQAEGRVLAGLAQGQSPGEIAAIHGVQVNTVQAQIKQLLAKTGTQRQAQLVALALRTGLAA